MRLIIKATSPASKKRGEEREGKYAARTQVGTEKDGSPMYRYFDTMDQYKNYMDKKGRSPKEKTRKFESDKDDDKEDSIKEKTSKEHKESTKKIRESHRRAKERSLFVKDTKKSFLYIKGDK